MTTMTENILPRIYERDIDVLLQEELIFNPSLCGFLAQKLNILEPMSIDRCDLSVVDATGETDLLVFFSSGGLDGRLLIENKIDAAFQPMQPERYRDRALSLAVNFDGPVKTILIAPASYTKAAIVKAAVFDATVTYEDIADRIESMGTDRSIHRAGLIRRAIQLARSSYILVPSDEATEMWRRVFQIAIQDFADLKFAEPGSKGSGSSWIVFKAGLPACITIDWKITKATVDLSFWRGAAHKPIEAIDLGTLNASSDHTGNTTLIRIPVSKPPAKWSDIGDFEIREALSAAVRLLAFYRANPHSFA
jgi:hypothetical protein